MTDLALIERITRSLAFMLRHQPEKFDLDLDPHGFAELEDVVHALNERLGEAVTESDVREAVMSGDRVRYEIEDQRIRALYGHSIPVEPGPSSKPPEVLFVAIPEQDVDRAQRYGLRGGRRRFLHLALTKEDACDAGRRMSRHYTVLRIRALDAWEEGIGFYDRKALWLAEEVPTHLIEVEGTYHDGTDPVVRGPAEGGRFQDRGRDRGRERDSRSSHRGRGRGRHGDQRGRGGFREGEGDRAGRERPSFDAAEAREREAMRGALPRAESIEAPGSGEPDHAPVSPGGHEERGDREPHRGDRGDRGDRRDRGRRRPGDGHGDRHGDRRPGRQDRPPREERPPLAAREPESRPAAPPRPPRAASSPSSPFGAGLDGEQPVRSEPPRTEEPPRRPAREERPRAPDPGPPSDFGAGLS